MPTEHVDALVRWMAGMTLRELRARQSYAIGLLARLNSKPHQFWHDYEKVAASNAEFDRGVCSAAIDLRTFGDDGTWKSHLTQLTKSGN